MTAIYYSANTEREPFATKIRQTMLAAKGDAEVIAVTQQPVDLPVNIVVGNVGWSGFNAVRQLQIGVQAAQTEFVCNIECDTIYPPDYYSFCPQSQDVLYLAEPSWLAFVRRGERNFYSLKGVGFEGALVASRDALLHALDRWMDGMPEWIQSDDEHAAIVRDTPHPLRQIRHKPYHWTVPTQRFVVSTPVLSFKTAENLHRTSRHSRHTDCKYLEPWGSIERLMQEWCA